MQDLGCMIQVKTREERKKRLPQPGLIVKQPSSIVALGHSDVHDNGGETALKDALQVAIIRCT